jgi:arylsulfatase A-like enzyme
VISFNDYDHETGNFTFKDDSDSRKLKRHLKYFEQAGAIPSPDLIEDGQQIDTFTEYPYDPISLDSRARYGSPTNTPLTGEFGFDERDVGQANILGLYSLSKDYTPTHFTGDVAKRAIRRLQDEQIDGKPWFVTVSLHSPHPPMVPSWEYLEKYWNQRENLHVPRNLLDDLEDSNYDSISSLIPEYSDPNMIQELTAIYYALCEEVDAEVGTILAELDPETIKNTLIVFTADHGEMLGSHGKREKSNFYEEASKVPLMFSFPGVIKEGSVIDEKVSKAHEFGSSCNCFFDLAYSF